MTLYPDELLQDKKIESSMYRIIIQHNWGYTLLSSLPKVEDVFYIVFRINNNIHLENELILNIATKIHKSQYKGN